ncbi:MAG: nuclear transport factor 2 family protein [Paracoccaceae bacterium]
MSGHAAEYDAVAQVVEEYFDGLYFSDTKRLRRVFHPLAQYVCVTDGTLLYRTMEEYFPVVNARPAPAQRGEARADRILSIEFAGPGLARAVLNCAIGDRFFTDWLTFVKLEGRWQVMSKIFHYETREAA